MSRGRCSRPEDHGIVRIYLRPQLADEILKGRQVAVDVPDCDRCHDSHHKQRLDLILITAILRTAHDHVDNITDERARHAPDSPSHATNAKLVRSSGPARAPSVSAPSQREIT